ncbi:hypothetical protein EMIHUDRAFT_194276 [Emiliania huxleyi CCMP1516]|uniref:G-protein coupled receptors family 2 profile 2 domain-containing protein n=2 Tax=Emiliania huxleyi TaxID=2903 RepID=A0A0D3L185_EMIH1|nr:hypothetical protein EMIHUDRAFT_194276 [Emiliania huxleyi CCMP1516]EOD41770.1 hypothetical protein EMIHUDRAFT_194276 [Emiliania huxleyi CCMP1516]|eukprot:XP_005794199.1 hypothetical protein EMIHUDRAFT_194276 [Emiliania huxleyi CCMP1516]
MSLAGEGQLLVGLSGEGEPLMGLAGEGGRKTPLSLEEEWHLRLIVFVSATLSLAGTSLVLVSMYRFRELSKRFFAMRLIGYLAVADGFASIFNMCGVLVDTAYPAADGAPGDSPSPLCEVQAVGLLYFNLASIFWTSCFARTLYRDLTFHALCWPLPALLAGGTYALGYVGDAGSYCAVGPDFTPQYLLAFYLPLVGAFAFNTATYALVCRSATEARVSRSTSLYLLVFAVVWLPSLLGALNAFVYGWTWSDRYRTMLLGTDSLDAAAVLAAASHYRLGSPPTSEYSPAEDALLGLTPRDFEYLPPEPSPLSGRYSDRPYSPGRSELSPYPASLPERLGGPRFTT